MKSVSFISLCKMDDEEISKMWNNALPQKNTDHYLVNNAKRFIEENYRNQITVKDISSELNVAYSHLSCIFSECTGLTLKCYLLVYMLFKAKGLLETSDLSISEISRITGFKTMQYFSRRFTELFAESARDYRRNNMKII